MAHIAIQVWIDLKIMNIMNQQTWFIGHFYKEIAKVEPLKKGLGKNMQSLIQ